jgi:putative peptidoglycan lipid II flippase
MRAAVGTFVPVVAARGVVNLSGLLDMWLAGLLASGAATMLSFAYAIYVLPISLFGMSIAASELPELSRQEEGDGAEIGRRIAAGLERVSFFVVPSLLAFLVLGGEIVGLIYQTGEFGADQTTVTWAVLAAYSLGLLATTRSRLLTSAFYALRDARTPARVATFRVVLAAVVGVSTMFYLDRFGSGPVRFGAVGLGAGATAGAWFEYVALRRALALRLGGSPRGDGRAWRVWMAAGSAAVIGGAVAGLLPRASEFGWAGVPGPVLHGLGTLVPFGVAYLGLAQLLGVAGPLRSAFARGSR